MQMWGAGNARLWRCRRDLRELCNSRLQIMQDYATLCKIMLNNYAKFCSLAQEFARGVIRKINETLRVRENHVARDEVALMEDEMLTQDAWKNIELSFLSWADHDQPPPAASNCKGSEPHCRGSGKKVSNTLILPGQSPGIICLPDSYHT